ncbi:MAG: 50S ribosomal protein L9 [Bacilli bacterium]|nr:50S ribosomal protein L9 [Bacilli bacterium]
MKVILLADVKKVGKKDQIIEVSDGYAQNFLIARKLAVPVSATSKAVLQKQKDDEAARQAQLREEAKAVAEQLKSITLEFTVQSGKDGKMFGNISLKQVSDQLANNYHLSIDKRKFLDKGPLDILGFHHLKIELYKGVIGEVNVHIKSKGE